MRYIFFILMFSTGLGAQTLNPLSQVYDSLVIDNGQKDSVKIFKPTINDYKIKTQFTESKSIDTTFSVQHYYRFSQYNNRDNFGKIQFANIGSGFQNLVYGTDSQFALTLLPERKSHFIIGIDQVSYYDVKTPTTAFVYHTAMRNGAALQSTYTQNIGKRFNFALEYMGLRSQGFYNNSLAANNHTLFSGHYLSDTGEYEVYAHYLHQNVNNGEYGGIKDLNIYLSGDPRFNNRTNLRVGLQGSDSRFAYRRYYFSHYFSPFGKENNNPFKIGHTIYHQGNKYYFNIGSGDLDFFEYSISNRGLNSKKYSEKLSNSLSIFLDKERFKLDFGVRHQNIRLGSENGTLQTGKIVGYHYVENRWGILGNLEMNPWRFMHLKSFAEYSNGSFLGNYFHSGNRMKFNFTSDYFFETQINFQSALPSFNYLLHVSPVLNYNYDNVYRLSNQNILKLAGSIGLKWWNTQLFVHYFRVAKYTYFDAQAQVKQTDNPMVISQLGGESTWRYSNIHLNMRLLVQNHLQEKKALPMPHFVGRMNLYWQSKAFKNAAEIMTGIKANYFSRFGSRDFSPLLNEFVLPDNRAYPIGGQAVWDVYFNMKVKTMQFYIEAQNITTPLIQNKTYTVPYYPVYDFRLNVGIVWYLFH